MSIIIQNQKYPAFKTLDRKLKKEMSALMSEIETFETKDQELVKYIINILIDRNKK